MILLLFDNFTYTMFQFGIVSSYGILRTIYALGYFIFFVLFTWKTYSWSKSIGSAFIIRAPNVRLFIVSIVLIVLSLVVPLIHQTNKDNVFSGYKTEKTNGQLPNIFLITADGLNADHMSIYGYDRRTTPFLDGWENQSMVIENGFTNSAKTTGSIVSILNGRYATDTRVLYPPDILTNEDSYQHLPGILKSLGYYTIQYGQSYYADAYAQNLLKGFDEVFHSSVEKSNVLETLNSILPEDIAYFVYDLFNRLTDRLFHIFHIKAMNNVFLQVTGTSASFEDYPKLHHMFQLIENVQQPLFVHLHWMGTHGELFYPKEQVYSAETDIKNQMPWNNDFYDDSILEFDETIQGIVDILEDNSLAENTVFVIASDHGQRWSANERLPLIFHFPHSEFTGHISMNSQNIDIAPTLLDYLGIKIPDWMDGISLLPKNINDRLVFSLDVKQSLTEDEKRKYLTIESYDPPFYQFGKISIIDCDRFYELHLEDGFNLESSTIANYETQCDYQVESDTEAVRLMIDHLAQNKFDISTLEEWLKSFPSP
ncbi:MAG: sulfatase-like hydrolase/transferase [Anaerolineaceae bacterium]|nr:sulfatase-like hydrolase/transferase [Anaerolineaceae bacterium]